MGGVWRLTGYNREPKHEVRAGQFVTYKVFSAGFLKLIFDVAEVSLQRRFLHQSERRISFIEISDRKRENAQSPEK